MLINNGVPSENIILFLNNGFSNNTEFNPFPGGLYTDKQFSRNYHIGLKIDYSGNEINVENYMAVLRGDASAVKGGTGRVLRRLTNFLN